MEPEIYDTIIIGGGAAGIAAAIYTVRKNLKVLMLTKNIGGQAALSGDVENYPGFTLITGADLAKKFREELINFENHGLWIKEGVEVVDLAGADPDFSVKTSEGQTYHGKTVIIASGRIPKMLGIPGEKQFLGKGVATCATCLPPDESVIGNSSIKPIKDITNDQRVLTYDGVYRQILDTTKRFYEGDLVSIKTRFFTEPVLLTPNHPVLKCNITKGNWWTGYKNFKWSNPEWVPAGILKKGDIVFYPIVQETKYKKSILISDFLDVKVDGSNLAYYKHETYTAHRIPNRIPINDDFLRLMGYFLAEGSITPRGINFYFNKKEQEYIIDVTRIIRATFNLKPTVKNEGSVARIMVFSKMVGQLFELLLSKYSYNKRIPHFIVILDKNKQKELVKGLFRGDGCIRDKDFCLVTNSRTLTYQLRDILLRLGIIPQIQIRKLEQLKSSIIDGRTINFRHDKYHLIIGGTSLEPMSALLGIAHPKLALRKRTHSFAWIRDRQVLLPIKDISYQEYKGEVCNLAVEESNTYVAKNFVVHNCDAPFYKDKDVAVVGGGNSALDTAFSLLKVARSVFIINITDSLRGDEILMKNVTASPKVKILNNHEALEILGDQAVGGIKVKDQAGQEQIIPVSGVFIEIGWSPSTYFDKLTDKNDTGEIEVDEYGASSVPGIYAAGDVNNIWGEQIVIAAGEGAKTALRVVEHLSKVPHQDTSNIHEG